MINKKKKSFFILDFIVKYFFNFIKCLNSQLKGNKMESILVYLCLFFVKIFF
jgi:hypothetical protein